MEMKASPDVILRAILPGETRPLRKLLLRPDLDMPQLNYPGDEEPLSLHVGAFCNGEMAGIASVYLQSPRDSKDADAWRLRGMATTPAVRGTGAGGLILKACIAHAARHGGRYIWCDARLAAVWFYEHYGFLIRGAEYDIPHVGPHHFMWRALTPTDAALAILP